MSFQFTVKEFILGNGTGTPTLQFYKRGFELNGSGTSPSWQDIILSGNTALTLVNAKADGLNYLKLFGGTEQRNLPSGHQQLSYLQGDGTAYIETDVEPTNNTGMKIVFEYATSGSAATSGIYANTSPRQDTFFISTNTGSVDTSFIFCAHRGVTLSQTSAYSEAPVSSKTYTMYINYKNSGTMGIEGFTQDAVGTENVLTNKVLLFARLNYINNNITGSADKIKYVEFTEGTEVIRKYYPDSYNNELGLYDTITNTFLTNKNSSGSFTAGSDVTAPTPSVPMDIVCNNGVVKVSPNLLNDTNVVNDYSATGNYTYKGYFPANYSSYTSSVKYRVAHCVLPVGSYRFETDTANAYILRYAIGSTVTELLDDNLKQYIDFTLTTTTEFSICWRNSTTTEFTGEHSWISKGATTYMPYGQIYADGTTEKVEVFGKNLFDKDGEFIEFNSVADYIGIAVPNGTYTCSTNIPEGGSSDRNAWFDNQNTTFSSTVNGVSNIQSRTVTASNGMVYFAIRKTYESGLLDGTYWVQIEQGSSATTYENYFNGGSATAEDLLAVGTYEDEQNVTTGDVTKNVGIKALDGTENWTYNNSAFLMDLIDRLPQKNFMFCTHFNYDSGSSTVIPNLCIGGSGATNTIFIKYRTYNTVEQFKQYLADQYANGTPVIVVYPTSSPTTETVTGQELTTQAGTNIVEITQASIDNLELEVKYKATV